MIRHDFEKNWKILENFEKMIENLKFESEFAPD
jgi:hypothetical protein